ncbi:protein translocase subunit SecF [Actinomycetospora sp. TBRC 11914]|uniref:protein translocase subunit SecF n=1 Tax=Actinomycetospora sp. TBRC 11914 TaxID=2729387 RepID=UPI00145EF78B|nr:protein translocase subunit SecF [Actinomycetospora sp. TBRC 11914]NMO93774.1 protein translocase subunit SecF [Actinomycetospora sp. TBRC 11914]
MTRPTRHSGRRRPDADEPVDAVDDGPEPEDDLVADEPDDDVEGAAAPTRRSGRPSRLDRLYQGNGGIDIVGRSRTWYLLFGALVLVCVLSMVLRGFNFSIDFEGGTSVQFPARGASGVAETSEVQQVFDQAVGRPAESVQVAGTGGSATIVIKSDRLTEAEQVALDQALFQRFQPLGSSGQPDPNAVSNSAVSASWGGEITRQALIALAVFLVLVTAYLAIYFERRMAVAAIIALINDIVVTAGVYSLVGFEVSPATVIGLLTILGFSLYDTVVVFDKVRENTRGLAGLTRRTYAEAANLAVNQTLMRSLNTSLIAALPLIGLFVVGVVLLGVGVLGDLALVQLVGTIIGAASSVLLATPIVVDLAMRDRVWAQQAQRVAARREKNARRSAAGAGDTRSGVTTGEPTDVLDTDAVVAAAGAPNGRETRSADAGTRRSASAPRPGARPAGKTGRPSGKRRR